ncbi:hypothetical protein ETB55_21940 [Salmonella enterica subsp. enterica serovar Omuna]|nr:hypothetical protein [Salmonella enterica subsp. enterica serovar Omuna]
MKPLFKNLVPFYLNSTLPGDFTELIEQHRFDGLDSNDSSGHGFTLITPERRVIESDGRYLVCYLSQQKKINPGTAAQLLQERLDKLAEQALELVIPLAPINEEDLEVQIRQEMLRYAPIKSERIWLLICPAEHRLYASATSRSSAERATASLRSAIGSLKTYSVDYSADVSDRFTSLIKYPDSVERPAGLRVEYCGQVVCAGREGERLTTKNIDLDSETAADILTGLQVRSIELGALQKTGQCVWFQLCISTDDDFVIKKFNYAEDAGVELDTQQANEEGDGDELHQYTVEMLIVGRYAARTLDVLAEFCGGYRGEDRNGDEIEAEIQPGADERTRGGSGGQSV